MKRYEYARIPIHEIPMEIRIQYELHLFEVNGYIYFEVRKGMYVLPQAGLIAYEALKEHLAPHGYKPCRHTPGLWKHETRNLQFCLIVDDFGVKYSDKADANHLIANLQKKYKISIDWEGRLFCGITLTWDYLNGNVTLSMPGYVAKCLIRFKHIWKKLRDAPHPWNTPAYGTHKQYADIDISPYLDDKMKTFILMSKSLFCV